MPMPTKMKPNWDMEEQASVRFKSREKMARMPPSSMVTTPNSKIVKPQ